MNKKYVRVRNAKIVATKKKIYIYIYICVCVFWIIKIASIVGDVIR
jgi:uncharacterized membrane protein